MIYAAFVPHREGWLCGDARLKMAAPFPPWVGVVPLQRTTTWGVRAGPDVGECFLPPGRADGVSVLHWHEVVSCVTALVWCVNLTN